MSLQEAVVAVLVAAIFANIVLAIGLIVAPRLRARRESTEGGAARQVARPGQGLTTARPTQGVAGAPVAHRFVPVTSQIGRPNGSFEPAGSGSVGSAEPAATDPVTGFELPPRWSKWLDEEGARIDRYGRPATIVLIKLGGLDRLAERLGPEAANRLIPAIATTMRRHGRACDNLARLGRATFGALLTETDEIRAINYVERVRNACDVWLESGAVALRLSIGWAEIGANRPIAVAVQAAEGRLNEEHQRQRAWSNLEPDAEPTV